jgi:hypothetical protein
MRVETPTDSFPRSGTLAYCERMMQRTCLHVLKAVVVASGTAAIADTTVTTFDKGADDGWIGPNGSDGFGGSTTVVATGGNPAWNMRTVFNDFGIPYINVSNGAFLGDYTSADRITLSIDLKVENLRFFGTNVSRPWVVELRDVDGATGGYPWNSVWFKFAQISQSTHGSWTTFSVTFDPSSTSLPPGWRGTGAEDPVTYEPVLPAGVTFRDVLSGVDAIAFTTLQPGMFFGFTDHSFRIDNIRITREVAPAGDLNGDWLVNGLDLTVLLAAWGPCAAPCAADLDRDGTVGGLDLAALLASWS